MEFSRLVSIVGEEPVFESSLLLAGDVDPRNVRPFLEPNVDPDLLSRENLMRLLI